MTHPLLKVTDLHAGYGRAEVLHGINLEAAQGSVVTVIGPNGAGKSTLLNTLMGILPGQGKLEFDGQNIVDLTLEERVMLGIALVPEKRELFGTMPLKTIWCWGVTARCASATSAGAMGWNRFTRCSLA
jgi:branched-chain amino acid transport system ATP-binding protein